MSDAIAFCGSIGSGKTTLSKEISNELTWKYISFGNYVRREMTRLGFDTPTREQLQDFGASMISNGVERFCLSILSDLAWNMGDGAVFDGVRHLEVLTTLRRIFLPSKVFLIYIELDELTINNRLAKREINEDIQALKFHSTEQQVTGILKSNADLIVDGRVDIDENVYQICNWLDNQS
jgi:dephospho-CoA kinase